MLTRRNFMTTLAAGSAALGSRLPAWAAAEPARTRTAKSGPWSSPSTWEGGQVPAAGAFVEIATGHNVTYDVFSNRALRMVHVLGTLDFARDRNTRLDVGLLKIGGDTTEDGATCSLHEHNGARPALQIGTQDHPLPAEYTALIRLVYFAGSDRDSLPAVMCCGGRMDLHGAPMNRTWLKLGAPVTKGDTDITLSEPVNGWRAGDRIILTATLRQLPTDYDGPQMFTDTVRENTQTEEHIIKAVDGAKLTLRQPAAFAHICNGPYRGDVANLSRNIVIESADPKGERGHTMYHHGSAGSISYAEFRHLGKLDTLGRYSVHFHLVRDSMRGTSVVGASIWDSDNRWITVHGTDYLVVRDVVGYNSIGHGYFLEDGTEVFNVFDRNLAVQGRNGKPLPNQVLPFDHNSGSGFWFANSHNTFTRNVACECDVYGFRFDMQRTKDFDPVLSVPALDGSRRKVDVRTLPFIRFADNESHCQRNHALDVGGLDINLEGGTGGVGPDVHHPFIVRNMRVWNAHWAFHPFSPSIKAEDFDIHNTAYGLWKPRFENHSYHNVHMENISAHVILDATGPNVPGLPWEKTDSHYPSRNVPPMPLFDLELPKTGQPLEPVDDLAPVVIATYVGKPVNGQVTLRGTATDYGPIKSLQVDGHDAHAVRPDFAEWEVTFKPAASTVAVRAEDAAGNVSTHKVRLS